MRNHGPYFAVASSARRAAFDGDAMVRPARISELTVYHAATPRRRRDEAIIGVTVIATAS